MGVWPYISRKFRRSEFDFDVVSRKESSSTATGYAKQHIAQQMSVIGQAFETSAGPAVKKKVEKTTQKVVNID
jgi:2-oxoglutarate dehydrogenase E1 component